MLWFFVGSNLLLNKGQARALVNWLVILGTLVALHGVYQYIIGVPIPENWVDSAETVRTRVFSIVGSPQRPGQLPGYADTYYREPAALRPGQDPKIPVHPLPGTDGTEPYLYLLPRRLAGHGGRPDRLRPHVQLADFTWPGAAAYIAPKLVPTIGARIGYVLSSAYLVSSTGPGGWPAGTWPSAG